VEQGSDEVFEALRAGHPLIEDLPKIDVTMEYLPGSTHRTEGKLMVRRLHRHNQFSQSEWTGRAR